MALAAAAIPGLIQGGAGLVQSIFGGGRARKAQKEMERMIDNYKPNQSIMDYYQKALARYNPNAYQSASYQQATQSANRNLAAGLSALGSRRSALAGAGRLVQGANDASLRAAANAEAEQARNLSQLGQATQMKDREDKYKFENKYNLLAMKAGGGNQIMNAGLQNIYGGLGNIASAYMPKDINK